MQTPFDNNDPEGSIFNSNSKKVNRSPAFHQFCLDELPPLSPSFRTLNQPLFSFPEPKKKDEELLIYDLNHTDYIEDQTMDHQRNFDLFDKYLIENEQMSPFSRKKQKGFGQINSEPIFQKLDFPSTSEIFRTGTAAFQFNQPQLEKKGSNPIKRQLNLKKVENDTKDPSPLFFEDRIDKYLDCLNLNANPKQTKFDDFYIRKPEAFSDPSTLLKQNIVNKNKPVVLGCKCKKTKCLKLYCECFAAKSFCKDTCSCTECLNREEKNNNKERNIAIHSFLVKNQPTVFKPEENLFYFKNDEVNNAVSVDKLKKGCNCRKSHCLKKYCECFEAKRKCDIFCKCEDCRNMEGGFLEFNKGNEGKFQAPDFAQLVKKKKV